MNVAYVIATPAILDTNGFIRVLKAVLRNRIRLDAMRLQNLTQVLPRSLLPLSLDYAGAFPNYLARWHEACISITRTFQALSNLYLSVPVTTLLLERSRLVIR